MKKSKKTVIRVISIASADDKADIKKQTVILIVGAVLVFAAVPFAKFITDIANQTLR